MMALRTCLEMGCCRHAWLDRPERALAEIGEKIIRPDCVPEYGVNHSFKLGYREVLEEYQISYPVIEFPFMSVSYWSFGGVGVGAIAQS